MGVFVSIFFGSTLVLVSCCPHAYGSEQAPSFLLNQEHRLQHLERIIEKLNETSREQATTIIEQQEHIDNLGRASIMLFSQVETLLARVEEKEAKINTP